MEEKHIHLTIIRNEQQEIERITWQASDAEQASPQDVNAFMLSLFDAKAQQTLRLDLWSQMTIDDMNQLFYQTFLYMGETYKNATGNSEIMADISNFAQEFGEKARAFAETMMRGSD
ncbi:MAG: hypothetical protein AAF708_11285 [Deinococcota bacterium]